MNHYDVYLITSEHSISEMGIFIMEHFTRNLIGHLSVTFMKFNLSADARLCVYIICVHIPNHTYISVRTYIPTANEPVMPTDQPQMNKSSNS